MPRGYPGTGPTAKRSAPVPEKAPNPARPAPSRAPALQARLEDARLAQLAAQMADLQREVERRERELEAESRYGEDDFEEGAVVTWTQRYPGRGTSYSYAAIKAAAGMWYTTSKFGQALSWSELVQRHLSQSDDAAYVDTVVPL